MEGSLLCCLQAILDAILVNDTNVESKQVGGAADHEKGIGGAVLRAPSQIPPVVIASPHAL